MRGVTKVQYHCPTNKFVNLSKAMSMMNRQMNLPAMQKIMMEFEQQTEKMDMKEEMMNDTLDDVMEADDDEEKSDEILNQVYRNKQTKTAKLDNCAFLIDPVPAELSAWFVCSTSNI